jgi:hypothetical protein
MMRMVCAHEFDVMSWEPVADRASHHVIPVMRLAIHYDS